MTELYIFATTDRPDQYLNSIVHCIEKGVRKIVFVQIQNSEIQQVKLNSLIKNVSEFLEILSTGSYKHFSGKNKNTIVDLSSIYSEIDIEKLKTRYSLCQDYFLKDRLFLTTNQINYLDLRSYISQLSNCKDAIIDVTAISKVYIGDIFACSLLENFNRIFTFVLSEKPNFEEPWRSLIHELVEKGQEKNKEDKIYRYLNLVDTPIFKEGNKSIFIRRPPKFISVIITLAAIFILGFNSLFIQILSTIGTVLGIISFLFVYFPPSNK